MLENFLGQWTLAHHVRIQSSNLEFTVDFKNGLKTLTFPSVFQLLNEANNALKPYRNAIKDTS